MDNDDNNNDNDKNNDVCDFSCSSCTSVVVCVSKGEREIGRKERRFSCKSNHLHLNAVANNDSI